MITRLCALTHSVLTFRRTLVTSTARRNVSHDSTEIVETRVRDWISKITTTTHTQEDRIDPFKLQLLDLTLPPFNTDTQNIPNRSESGTPIVPGTELTLFPPLVRTDALFPDGTDSSYSSPAPFSRRMWAGGAFAFDTQNRLCVGQDLRCETTVEDVELKGWEKARETGMLGNETMVFVKQRREISNENGLAVVERRTHVYRPEISGLKSSEATGKKKVVMHSEQHPPDKQFTFTPSAHTLFRFSALTFNSHRIHLDPVYSSQQEGHEDRLVHGPLTALLLLRFANFVASLDQQIVAFKYRAIHPLVVDRHLTLNLRWTNEGEGAEVWATSDKGVIGMKATVVFSKDDEGRKLPKRSTLMDGVAGGLFLALASGD